MPAKKKATKKKPTARSPRKPKKKAASRSPAKRKTAAKTVAKPAGVKGLPKRKPPKAHPPGKGATLREASRGMMHAERISGHYDPDKDMDVDSTGNTGYMSDLNPAAQFTGMPGKPVPRAEHRRKMGIVPPAEKSYIPGQHKVVDAEEAISLAKKRQRGKAPPIQGSIAYEPPTGQVTEQVTDQVEEEDMGASEREDFDPMGFPGDDENEDFSPGMHKTSASPPVVHPGADSALPPFCSGCGNPSTMCNCQVELQRTTITDGHGSRLEVSGGDILMRSPQRAVQAPLPVNAVPAAPSRAEQYLNSQPSVVDMEMESGTVTLTQVYDLLVEPYSITMLLRLEGGGATFIPKPGSEIVLSSGGGTWKVYYPGAKFTVPDLNVLGLVFIRADENN